MLTCGRVEDVSASTGSWLRWAQCRICHNDSAAPVGGGAAAQKQERERGGKGLLQNQLSSKKN